MSQVVIFNDKSKDVLSLHRRTLGPYRIAQALKDAGYTVQVVEWFSSWSRDDLALILDKLVGSETLWVGWSSTFMVGGHKPNNPREFMWSRPLSDMDWVFDYIKARSKAWLVYGGAYAHLFACDPRIDIYVTGYADVSVVSLTDSISRGELPPRFVDSRTYPEPDVNNITVDWTDPRFLIRPNEAIPIEFARGCIFQCKFCNYPLIGKRKGTYQRPADQIRQQLLDVYNTTGCTRFYFTDDTFNDDRERLAELHAMFKTLPFKPEFSCFLRLDLIERWPETADLLLEMGLKGCFFGVETFNKKSAQCIGKGLDPKRTKAELFRLREVWGDNIRVSVGLILGLPYDTEEYFKELEEWITNPNCPASNFAINTLWLGPPAPEGATQADGWSQFNLNTEVYGYERMRSGWKLENGLDSTTCDQWRFKLLKAIEANQRISEFYVQDYTNAGVTQEDMLNLTPDEIHRKYNFKVLIQDLLKTYQNNLIEFLGIK